MDTTLILTKQLQLMISLSGNFIMLYLIIHSNVIFLEMSEGVKVGMKLFQLFSLMGE